MGRTTPGFRGGYHVDGSRQYTLAIFGAVLMCSLVFLAYIATNYLAKNQAAYSPYSRCERVIGGLLLYSKIIFAELPEVLVELLNCVFL